MSEHQSFIKDKADCQCGDERCTKFGTLGKEDRSGKRHVRGCPCRVCLGRRSNKAGHDKQRVAARALGLDRGRGTARDEEHWGGYFANEVKSGKQVGPVATWWARVEKQVLANQADFGGLRKPVRAVAMPEGMSDGLVVVRLSTWREHIAPALNEFYGSES